MRFLITGGAGFIGSHLAELLLSRDNEVLLLDDLSTGSMENIRHLKQYPKMKYFLDSLENRQLLAELVDGADVIVHLAAAVGVRLIVESPVRTIETNVNGTQLVLDAAVKKRKLVFIASTSEVYGKNTEVPFREGADLVLGPTSKNRWSYAASKALDEFLALAYWKEKRQPVVIARLFNTVGPPADRPLWDGFAQLCQSGAGRGAHYGLRKRPTVALFLRRARRGRGDHTPDCNGARAGPGGEYRAHRRGDRAKPWRAW